MSTKNLRVKDEPDGLDFNVSTLLGAQLAVLRDLALALVKEVESFELDSAMALEDGISLHNAVRHYEIQLIKSALRLTNGHQMRASQLLGLKATTLNSKIKRYRIVTFSEVQAVREKLSS